MSAGRAPLLIVAPWGLGDAIYARPLIAEAARQRQLYLETPWPELYSDLDVRFVRGARVLRTQMRNVVRQPASLWSEPPPPGTDRVALGYGPIELAAGNVYSAMRAKMPDLAPRRPVWSLPALGECPLDTGGAPLALVRPVVRRSEWDNEARNPLPEYINEIAADLKARGFAVVVVCDLSHDQEWLQGGQLPPHNAAFTHGEMSVRQLLATVRDASVVVGGVGWIVPACIALRTPVFVVLGGNGGMNAPEKLIDPAMDATRIGFATPAHFCDCIDMRHACDKRIPNLAQQWRRWAQCTLGTARSRAS